MLHATVAISLSRLTQPPAGGAKSGHPTAAIATASHYDVTLITKTSLYLHFKMNDVVDTNLCSAAESVVWKHQTRVCQLPGVT
jgi:hypothetical protein